MARKLHSRLKICGTLMTETALHVGGYGASPDTDLPLAQNGKGNFYIPGTSIAGVLRAWCEKNFRDSIDKRRVDKIVTSLFGFQKADSGQASFVIIEDIELAENLQSEIRDSVGIDRFYGTASDQAKFDRAVLPRGTKLNLVITIEIQSESDSSKIKAIFGHLLEALQKGEIRFGASRTRGLGRAKLTMLHEIQEQKFNDILNWLNSNGCGQKITVETEIIAEIAKLKSNELTRSSEPRLEIKIEWKPRLPVMVKAGYDGIGVDMLPLTSGVKDGELALCLPGSSIKGVLRSYAERIMRTLLGNHETHGKKIHEQINNIPLIDELFGAKKEREKPNQPKSTLGLGALAVDDCYEKSHFEIEKWRAVEIAKADSETSAVTWELNTRLRALPNAKFRINHHVAIDRWTGGASESALYSVLAPSPQENSWEEIILTLDFSRLRNCELPALMLLLLVLRDVAENRLPFGFATNRGMGEIEVNKIKFDGASLSKLGFTIEKGDLAALKSELKNLFTSEAWKKWLNNLNN